MTLDEYLNQAGLSPSYDGDGNFVGYRDPSGELVQQDIAHQQYYAALAQQAQAPAPAPVAAPEPVPAPQGALEQLQVQAEPVAAPAAPAQQSVEQYAESIGATWIPPGDEGGGGYWRVPGRGDEGGAGQVSTENLQREAQGLPVGGYSFVGQDGRTYYSGGGGNYDYWAQQFGYEPSQVTATSQYGDQGILDNLAVQIGQGTSNAGGGVFNFLDNTNIPLMMGGLLLGGALSGALPVAGEAAATTAAAADAAGLAQMAADAGLSGEAAAAFVESGGTLGSTAAGGGGVGFGAAEPFGPSGGSLAQEQAAQQAAQVAAQQEAQWGANIRPPVPEYNQAALFEEAQGPAWISAAEQKAAVERALTMTGSYLGDAAGSGALKGALTSLLTGGDLATGALTGGVLGGAGNLIGGITPGLTDMPAVNQAIGGGAIGALAAGMGGGDPLAGAASGAATPLINAATGAIWNASRNAWEMPGQQDALPDSGGWSAAEQDDFAGYQPQDLPPQQLTEAQQNMVAGLNQWGSIASDAPPPEAGTQIAAAPDYGAFASIFGLPGTTPMPGSPDAPVDNSGGWSAAAQDDFAGYQPPPVIPDNSGGWSVAPQDDFAGYQAAPQQGGAVASPYVPVAAPAAQPMTPEQIGSTPAPISTGLPETSGGWSAAPQDDFEGYQTPATITEPFAPGYDNTQPMAVPGDDTSPTQPSLASTGATQDNTAGANDMPWYTDLINAVSGAPAAEGVQDASVFQDPYQGLGYSQADIDALLNGTYSGPEQTPAQSQEQLGSLYDLTTGGATQPGAPVTTGVPTVPTPGGVNTGPNAGGSGASSGIPAWASGLFTQIGGVQGLLRGLPGVIGAIGANRQANQLGAIADRQFAVGQPSRSRYEGSFAPDFTMNNDPGFLDALNQASKANLHGLSTGGNPALSPNAQYANTSDLYQKFAYPALQNYRNTNASAGALSTLAAGAPAAQTNAITAQAGVPNALMAGANNIFSPPGSLEQALATLQKAGVFGMSLPKVG